MKKRHLLTFSQFVCADVVRVMVHITELLQGSIEGLGVLHWYPHHWHTTMVTQVHMLGITVTVKTTDVI